VVCLKDGGYLFAIIIYLFAIIISIIIIIIIIICYYYFYYLLLLFSIIIFINFALVQCIAISEQRMRETREIAENNIKMAEKLNSV